MMNALMGGAVPQPMPPAAPQSGAAPPQQAGGQAPPAPPTHAQTVAALRHFDAIRKEIGMILKDPALGKSNVKSKITDGVVRLVSGQFMSPTDAVDTLTKVPEEPLQQMQWAKAMEQQARQAENGILDHYGATNPNMGAVQDHMAMPSGYDPNDHADHMAAVMANYSGGRRG